MRSQELLWRTKDPEILRQLGKDISGCGLSGIINTKGKRISGEAIRCSIACQHERGNEHRRVARPSHRGRVGRKDSDKTCDEY